MFRFLRKSATFTVDQLAGFSSWVGWTSSAGGAVTEANALDVTAVFCAARVIAEGIGQMPVRVVEQSFTAGTDLPSLKIRRDHWAHRLLAVKPNGWQTSYEFREGMIFNAALGRGAIAIKNIVRDEVRRRPRVHRRGNQERLA